MAKAVNSKQKGSAVPVNSPTDSVTAGMGDQSYDKIQRLAYSIWEARGDQGGTPEEDWLRAEQELARQGTEAPNRLPLR